MLDRLISGAGAVTDGADRSVRLLAGGTRGGFATRPGSLAVAVLLLILAGMLVLAGLEATDPSVPVALAPVDVAASRVLADRTYATMDGSIASSYVSFFEDDNGNGTEDAGEDTVVWYYWLVDRTARTGVTVRSARPPEDVFTFRGSGVLIGEPGYPRGPYQPYLDEAKRAGLAIGADVVVDTTDGRRGVSTSVDLAAPLPPTGTPVELSGARIGSFLGVCRRDADADRVCDPEEEDMYEILVFDSVSRNAIRVLVNEPPEFNEQTSLTGQLRREERAVDAALTAEGFDFRDLDLTVSDRYVLDDGSPAGSAPLAFGLAAGLVGLATVILVGLAGGYLIYRRAGVPPPMAATTLLPGERMPLHVTGLLRTPSGLEHVREAPAELIRFVLGRASTRSGEAVVGTSGSDPADRTSPGDAAALGSSPGPALPKRVESIAASHPDPVDAAADAEAAGGSIAGDLTTSPAFIGSHEVEFRATIISPEAGPSASTLIVERVGAPQGVALGLGELTRLSVGQVMTLRMPRPALRVVAGTGVLVLSFDSEAERDRAAAELLDETGLGPDGKHNPTR